MAYIKKKLRIKSLKLLIIGICFSFTSLLANPAEGFCPISNLEEVYLHINQTVDSLLIFKSALKKYCQAVNEKDPQLLVDMTKLRNQTYESYLNDYTTCIQITKDNCPVMHERCPKTWASPCEESQNLAEKITSSG